MRKEFLIKLGDLPGGVHSHAANHAPGQIVLWFQNVVHHLRVREATVDEELEVREFLFELQYPIVLQGWDRPILLWIESLQESLTCVNDELVDAAALADYRDKVHDVFPLVNVVDAETALNGDGNVHCLDHFLADVGHKLRRVHQLGPETTLYGFLTRAPAIQINFVVAPLLHNLGCLGNFHRVLSADLAHDRMLVLGKVEQLLIASLLNVDDCVLIDHFGVEEGVLCEHAHEETIVAVSDVDHWRYGDPLFEWVNDGSLEHSLYLLGDWYHWLFHNLFLAVGLCLLYLVSAVITIPLCLSWLFLGLALE